MRFGLFGCQSDDLAEAVRPLRNPPSFSLGSQSGAAELLGSVPAKVEERGDRHGRPHLHCREPLEAVPAKPQGRLIAQAVDLDSSADGKIQFMVTEYLKGIDFHTEVKQEGPLDVAMAVDCLRQVPLGLHALLSVCRHASLRGRPRADSSRILRSGG